MSKTSSGGGANINLWEVAKDHSEIPYRKVLLGEDVFEQVRWQLPVDPSTPIPVEIAAFLEASGIWVEPRAILYLKPSYFPCKPLPEPGSDDSESQSRTTSTDSSLYNYSADLNFTGEELDSEPYINFSADLDRGRDAEDF